MVGENSDGSLAIIDCKVSDNDRDSGQFYAPQLEAYAYSLENPAVGDGKKVSTTGLLIWSPKSADLSGFKVEQRYVPVPRDPERFNNLIEDLINMLEGEMPDSGEKCETCRFISNREALDL